MSLEVGMDAYAQFNAWLTESYRLRLQGSRGVGEQGRVGEREKVPPSPSHPLTPYQLIMSALVNNLT